MSLCPKCDRKLGRKRGEKFVIKATRVRPELTAYNVIWICPVHGVVKHTKAELLTMGALNRVIREAA